MALLVLIFVGVPATMLFLGLYWEEKTTSRWPKTLVRIATLGLGEDIGFLGFIFIWGFAIPLGIPALILAICLFAAEVAENLSDLVRWLP
jgi:hypothetical protein